MGVVETVKAKMRASSPKGPEDELRARLSRAEQDVAAEEKPYLAALKEFTEASQRGLFTRTAGPKQKLDRFRADLKEAMRRRDQVAVELAELEREKRLPAPWREARARLREAKAANASKKAELEEALRRGRLEDVRRLRAELDELPDALSVAESTLRNLAESDRAAARTARAEKLATAHARRRELGVKIDANYGDRVALVREVELVEDEIRALGEAISPIAPLASTPEALAIWRRGAWRELGGGGPPSAA